MIIDYNLPLPPLLKILQPIRIKGDTNLHVFLVQYNTC
jgi:hypothetical protein